MLPSHFLKIHLNKTLTTPPRSSKWSLSLGFPHHTSGCISSLSIRATHPAHLILFGLLTRRKIFGEECQSWSFSIHHSPLILRPPRPKYFPQHPILEHLSLCSSFNVTDQVSHPHKTGNVTILFAPNRACSKKEQPEPHREHRQSIRLMSFNW
jgi:hypothetical protein